MVLYAFFPIRLLAIPWLVLVGLIVTGYVWARQLAISVNATRKLRYAAVQVGDEMEESIIIFNRGWLPAWWIALQDESDFPGYSIDVVRSVSAGGKAEWSVNLICEKRGVFQLGPWRWVSSDPFGIFSIQRTCSSAQSMVVYPPLASLSEVLFLYGKQSGDLHPLNQPLLAESIQATQTRIYQPGDPLRRIHWRTTARKENLYVKTFDPDAVSRVWLLPDFDATVHNESDSKEKAWENSTEETMILVVSALASHLIKEHRAVGLFVEGKGNPIIMPQRGSGHLWTLLAALAPLHPQPDITLSDTLTKAAKIISPNDLLIAITPSVSVDWLNFMAEISHSRSGSEAWAFLLDRESFGMEGAAHPVTTHANRLGIHTRMVKKGEVEVIPGAMGTLRKWEYITTGTGRAVVRNRPRFVDELASLETGE